MSRKVQTEEPKKPAKKPDEQRAYVGPAFKDINSNVVFLGQLPTSLNTAMEECSAFKRLLVDVDDFAKAQKELENKDGVIFSSYKKACEYLKKGGK